MSNLLPTLRGMRGFILAAALCACAAPPPAVEEPVMPSPAAPEIPAAALPAPREGFVPRDQATPVAEGFEALGIEKVFLAPTALDTMLDFRFRVLDPAKALVLLRRGTADLVLVHQKTGQRLPVPVSSRVGPLRQTTLAPEAGRIYSTFFHNPGGMVRSGDRVTILVEDRRTHRVVGRLPDVTVD